VAATQVIRRFTLCRDNGLFVAMAQLNPSPEALPPDYDRPALWLPLAVLLVGLLITFAGMHQTKRFIEQERQGQFDSYASRMRHDLVLHTHRHIDVLRTYQAAYATHPGDPQEMLGPIGRVLKLDERLPGIDVLGYIVMAPGVHSDKTTSAIHYLYPEQLAGAPPATGRAGDPVRLEAVRRARDTGAAAATAPVHSALHPDHYNVVMIYLPLYRGGLTPDSLEERQQTFEGAVFLALQPTRLMEPLFSSAAVPDARIKLHFDGYVDAAPGEAAPSLLYDNLHGVEEAPALQHARLPLETAGTIWSIDVGMDDWQKAASQRWLPWAVLAAGILLSALCANALFVLQRSRNLSQRLASQDRYRRRKAEAELHLRHRAIESSANAIVIANATEPGYPVEYVNPAFERMTGYAAHEVVGQSLRSMHGADDDQEGLKKLQRLLRERRDGETALRNYRKDGQPYWTRIHLAPVRDESGAVTHFVAAKYDITETRRYQETLEFQAWHDALTHLPNRHLLRRRLMEAIRSSRPGSPPFWVAFLDMDNFKQVNDTLGHTMGDLALQQIAKRLQETLHTTDIVARRGGDEFVFILFDQSAPRNALATLHRIMSAVSRPLRLDQQRFFLACSIGIAIHPQDGDNPEQLTRRADMAMYHAKEQGRNNYQFFNTALQEQATERVKLERDLRAALANDEFELHYQPQIRLSDGSLSGMEALVRWHHPERGLLSPIHFIPMAEEIGLIVPLGEWILQTACRQASAWWSQGLPPIRMAVNLSARQFNDQNLSKLVHCTLQENLLAPQYLELELTETLLVDDVEAANATLQQLKSLGVTLSLDDFGTGYSSLTQLKRFPLDIIKIDRSFVSDITSDESDSSIVRTIIKLAHNLGMQALAEGVETTEQETFLREHGCDTMQGYLVSRPLPATEFEQWMRQLHISRGHGL